MKGILLVNTGSPKSKQRKDVKAFVGDMLSDPMVLTVPDWFRPILVKGFILPLRQFASTAHYSLIWDHENDISPQIYHMQELASKLAEYSGLPVEVAMRYQEPSMTAALDKMAERGVSDVIVVPLFPHYAESSYGTVAKEIRRCHLAGKYTFGLEIIEPYFNHPEYIKCLVDSLKPHLEEAYDRIVFTFHSLPLSHIEAARARGKEFDYVYQTKETVRLVCNMLHVDPNKVRQVYSSALSGKWLEPSLDDIIKQQGEKKLKRVIVISAGFSVDNLETLYDVGILARDVFTKHGGGKLDMVPCLNSNDNWALAIQKIIG